MFNVIKSIFYFYEMLLKQLINIIYVYFYSLRIIGDESKLDGTDGNVFFKFKSNCFGIYQ